MLSHHFSVSVSLLSHHFSVSVSLLILTNITWCDQRKNVQNTEGLSWSCGSWIYNYLCNQCLSPLTLWDRTPLKRGALDTTLCDEVCQWLATGRWFSPGSLVFYTNKTDRHDITEILLKVALSTINKPTKLL